MTLAMDVDWDHGRFVTASWDYNVDMWDLKTGALESAPKKGVSTWREKMTERFMIFFFIGWATWKKKTCGCFLKWYPHFTPQNDHF